MGTMGTNEVIMKQTIAEFKKNSKGEKVRIALSEYNGHDLVDIRIFFEPKEGGELKPTKKGICISVHKLADLINGLKLAGRTARDNGIFDESN